MRTCSRVQLQYDIPTWKIEREKEQEREKATRLYVILRLPTTVLPTFLYFCYAKMPNLMGISSCCYDLSIDATLAASTFPLSLSYIMIPQCSTFLVILLSP
jgi:hypothetical protein